MTKNEDIDFRLLMDAAIMAGELMLINGAETYRVEDTVQRMLDMGKCKHTHVVALTTSIIATISRPDMDAITVVRRITQRNTNLNKICLVNEISREFCRNEITLNEAFDKLKGVNNVVEYSTISKRVATVLVVPLFVILLGGSFLEIIIGLFAGALFTGVINICEQAGLNTFVKELLTAAVVSMFVAVCGKYIPILDVDLVVISSMIPLFPGVAITNAVRDTLQGDYMSGVARTLEAFVKASSLALGVLIGIGI